MTQNEHYIYLKRGDKTVKIEIEKNIMQSDDGIMRVHKAMPDDAEPVFYIIEQRMQINPDDVHGWTWRTLLQTADYMSAKRFIIAHNIGDAIYQHYALRQYARFDCPVTLSAYTYTQTI